MLLAAGEGTRLKPITQFYPKSLLPILSVPLLENIIHSLKDQGIRKVHINVCYLKENLIRFLRRNDFGVEINISEENRILGTGGGIGRMRDFIKADDFIVHNGDIVTNIRIRDAFEFHLKNRAIATLIVELRKGTKDVQLTRHGKIVDIAGRLGKNGEGLKLFGFTGIAIVNRRIFNFLPKNTFHDIIETYVELITHGEPVYAFESHNHYWLDIGTKERYLQVHRDILVNKKNVFSRMPSDDLTIFIGEGSCVSKNALLSGFVSIGKHCIVSDHVKLENCIVFDNARLVDGEKYRNCIISENFVVRADNHERTEKTSIN